MMKITIAPAIETIFMTSSSLGMVRANTSRGNRGININNSFVVSSGWGQPMVGWINSNYVWQPYP